YYEFEKKIHKAKRSPSVEATGSFGNAGEWFGGEHGSAPRNTPRLGPQWYAGVKMKLPIGGSTAEYALTGEKWPAVVSTFQGTEALTHSLKFYLFDKLKIYSEYQEADIEYIRAKQEHEKTSQDLTLEVNESYYSLRKALLQLDVAAAKVNYQEQEIEYTKMRRGLDEIPDSALIENLIKLSQERFGRFHALTEYYIAICTMDKAIGIEDYLSVEEE
ncbi:MAG: TolC family protein, partial [Candidatus Omnitrophota bacterium]